jgi:hypothetical protein
MVRDRMYIPGSLLLILALTLTACSNTGSPVVPSSIEAGSSGIQESRFIWGIWQVAVDLENKSLSPVQLRTTNIHFNALHFLEPPLTNITMENIKFNWPVVDVDIGLSHPFLFKKQFTGFDVCGTIITNGATSGFTDTDLVMAGPGYTRLLNADGYTRWWNPHEFPTGTTVFSYKDGMLGVPDSYANYNCTLNGYKLYSDDFIQPNDSIDSLDPTSRCFFSAGKVNKRHFTIEMGIIAQSFNYAISACWAPPKGTPPYNVPDDFGKQANAVEAWNVVVTETTNTLYNDGSTNGGDLSLSIDVWDHYDAFLNQVKLDSPGNFTQVTASTPVGGGPGYSTYELDVSNATPGPSSIDILITVQSQVTGYQGLLPGKPVCAYFMTSASVSPIGPSLTGKIVWASEQDGNREIYRMKVDGSLKTRLTFDEEVDQSPRWSPDGTKIVWSKGGVEESNIWIMNEDSTNPTQITFDGGNFNPTWDPTGQWIYYRGTVTVIDIELWRVKTDGSAQEQLTTLDYQVYNPYVSPDGQYVVFDNGDNLFTIGLDGSNPIQITNSPDSAIYPAVNSDGSRIMYIALHDGVFKIFSINPDGSGILQITDPPTNYMDWGYSYGPNDEYVLGARIEIGTPSSGEVGIYSIATGDFTQLTNNNTNDLSPDYHPNE